MLWYSVRGQVCKGLVAKALSRARRDKTSVLLVAMPWAKLEHPSIQLGILKTILDRADVPTQTWSAYLDLPITSCAPTVAEAAPPLTHLGYETFHRLSYRDSIFSVPPFHDTAAKTLPILMS